MKILVIDDNPTMAGLVAGQLKGAGHEVVVALDGVNGTMEGKRFRPDLLITDFQMPGANGRDVLERLRAGGMENLPVIVYTSQALELVKQRIPARARTFFVAKSAPFSEILHIVAELSQGPVSDESPRNPMAAGAPPDEPLDLDAS